MTSSPEKLSPQPLGFWIFIRNASDARYAIKMAGLPIVLNGLSYFVFAALDFIAYWLSVKANETIPNGEILGILSIFMALLAVYFVYSGIKMRKNIDVKIPPIFVILCTAYIISVAARLFLLSYYWSVYHIVFITFGLFPLLLVYGGMRGQKWIKTNISD